MEFSKKELGKAIRLLRVSESITQYNLAIYADMHFNTLSKVEMGHIYPSARNVIGLVNYFGVNISDCIADGDNVEKQQQLYVLTEMLNTLKLSDIEFLTEIATRMQDR